MTCPYGLKGKDGLAGELGVEVGGVPVLPGFDKAVFHNANDRSAGELQRLSAGGVKERRGPVHADTVAFGEGNDRSDAKLGELRAKRVVEGGEFVWAAVVAGAVVEDGRWREKFEDGLASGLVPDFFEPAMDEHFILFESGKRLGSGRHRCLLGKGVEEYTGKRRNGNTGGKGQEWVAGSL